MKFLAIIVDKNLVPSFRKRYLRRYKKHHTPGKRQLISIDEMVQFVKVPNYLSYQTLILFLAKTGVRRNELVTLDISDVDLDNLSVYLKKTAKRSNRTVFFDLETTAFMEQCLSERKDQDKALFVGRQNHHRIGRNQVFDIVRNSAAKIGLHNPNGRLDQRFGPHCARHWFTTWSRCAGMLRPFIQELRGDSRKEQLISVVIYKTFLKEIYRQFFTTFLLENSF